MDTRIELYDTTLRDGTQMEGISLSVDDKLKIARRMDELGVHYIEGGYPGSNPKDIEFFARASELNLKNALLTAFGATREAGGRADTDLNLKALGGAKGLRRALRTARDEPRLGRDPARRRRENMAMIG